MSIQSRQPSGIPVGGQFATSARTEPQVHLDGGTVDTSSMIGDSLEPASLAEVRRQLPVGTTVQVHYLKREIDGPIVRTVAKQGAYEMITEDDEGRGTHLAWAKQNAAIDANGLTVMSDELGTPYVAYRVLDNPDDVVTERLDIHPDLQTHFAEARTSSDVSRLNEISRSAIAENRKVVAENPAASSEILDRLADDEYVEVRRGVAGNPSTGYSTLARLATDPDDAPKLGVTKVRWLVANNPSTTSVALAGLANDSDSKVRSAVGRHANTSPETLRDLAITPMPGQRFVDGDVRSSVSSNPNTPPDVLARWEKSDGWTMPNVAKNPNTPQDVLVRLAKDTSTGNQTRAMVAANPAVPADVLTRLAREDDKWVREHAATNPRLSGADAQRLASDTEEKVRRAIAANPNADPRALARLAEDPSRFVRSRLASNPGITTETRRTLAADTDAGVRANAEGVAA